MSLDTFRAADVGWQREAYCKGSSYDFVPNDETPKKLADARSWCNRCPVRAECLAYALLYHLSGYWGGTDTAERRILGYPRDRVRCPDCKSKALVHTSEGHEICQACGMSWRSASGPRLARETVG